MLFCNHLFSSIGVGTITITLWFIKTSASKSPWSYPHSTFSSFIASMVTYSLGSDSSWSSVFESCCNCKHWRQMTPLVTNNMQVVLLLPRPIIRLETWSNILAWFEWNTCVRKQEWLAGQLIWCKFVSLIIGPHNLHKKLFIQPTSTTKYIHLT